MRGRGLHIVGSINKYFVLLILLYVTIIVSWEQPGRLTSSSISNAGAPSDCNSGWGLTLGFTWSGGWGEGNSLPPGASTATGTRGQAFTPTFILDLIQENSACRGGRSLEERHGVARCSALHWVPPLWQLCNLLRSVFKLFKLGRLDCYHAQLQHAQD